MSKFCWQVKLQHLMSLATWGKEMYYSAIACLEQICMKWY